MRQSKLIGPLLAVLALAGCASLVTPNVATEPAALRDGAYRLDPDHASLIFKIDHLGFSTYVGRFEKFDARLDFDADAPEAAQIDAAIDIASLNVANKAFEETLRGDTWFGAARFPQARFRSTSIVVTGENTGRMTGVLTLRGVSQDVSLEVVFNGGARDLLRSAYVVGFSAHGVISRSAFGVDALEGVISDEVALEIEAEFLRQ